jgi:hypothetical protein
MSAADLRSTTMHPCDVLAYVGMQKYWRGLGRPTTSRYGQPVQPVAGVINWKGRRDEDECDDE